MTLCVPTFLLLSVAMLIFVAGLSIAAALRDHAWREKAGGTRMASRGKLYRVTEE